MSILDSFRDDLVLDIDETLSLIRTINSLLSMTLPPPANITPLQRNLIVEWAFVNLHAEWEHFLESIFIAYMLGSQTDSGYRALHVMSSQQMNNTHWESLGRVETSFNGPNPRE
jgi:hypothetical protein